MPAANEVRAARACENQVSGREAGPSSRYEKAAFAEYPVHLGVSPLLLTAPKGWGGVCHGHLRS